jgi:homoserine O-acetyltransferase
MKHRYKPRSRSRYESLGLGDIQLQSGGRLSGARLTFLTAGSLNAARDNAIVMPTYYTGNHFSYMSMIGAGLPLDPRRYFIIVPNMFGNGFSSSPSNCRRQQAREFPRVTIYDNVMQQAELVFGHLRVAEIALVCGWSLGGMQAYQWATLFPQQVRRLLAFGSAARTSPYNFVFLDGLKATLNADRGYRLANGRRRAPARGLRAFGRVYAGWAYSHAFFRDKLYRALGHRNLEALLKSWEDDHLAFYAGDLLAMLDSWQCADISANDRFGGNFRRALRAIRARTTLVACSTDRYFPPVDNRHEADLIPRCTLHELASPFGHCAFSPGKVPSAMRFLHGRLRDLLRAQ